MAKDNQLHEMDPLCIILRWCTLSSKDLDDCNMMHTHNFNFGREWTFLYRQRIVWIFERGKVRKTNNKQYQEVSVDWTVPQDSRLCKYNSVLCYILFHLSKTTCTFVEEKEHGIPSLDEAPLLSHTRPVLPHTHLNLDLNPKTIRCYYYKNRMRCQSKKKIEKISMWNGW